MEWETYCDDDTLPLLAIKHTQDMIFHAYYWMGIAFICVCLMVAMLLWYFRQQQKRHPELVDLMADTSERELHKIQVNIYTNEIIIDGAAYPSRSQVVSLLDYLLKQSTQKFLFGNSTPSYMRTSLTVRQLPNGESATSNMKSTTC